jgi:hypothetical protein
MTMRVAIDQLEAKQRQLIEYRDSLLSVDGEFKNHARVIAEGRLAQIGMDIALLRSMVLARGEQAGSIGGREMKLDAKFYGVIVKVKDNTIVPDDEYVVFLAKDTAFADTLPTYLKNCIKLGADEDQIASVRRMIERLTVWRASNISRLKTPDAKGEKLLG